MSAAQVIEAFKELPAEQRAEVLRAAQAHGPELTRRLSPDEIGELAERLAAATTEEEAATIKRQMINGYYGAVIDAQDPAGRPAAWVISPSGRSRLGARNHGRSVGAVLTVSRNQSGGAKRTMVQALSRDGGLRRR